ncbi:MAG TPA: cytochrome c3 family protein [Phycisphaerae bacterium]|nr:cytochrome c3 family protein [Phycisphaerales bacterium]HRX87278.1 cytochrome c3 family protein [Phycisphaerae bacterium]
MAQVFGRVWNTVSRLCIAAVVIGIGVVAWGAFEIQRGPWVTREGMARPQPVPFSHEHHVGGLGLDCRYCHTGVETSSFAGLPPTHTCMTCHSKMWSDADTLAPVRNSWKTGERIEWTKVYTLPDYVFFNHSIHVNKGIGCSTCHGQVDEMPLMWSVVNLKMEWCLNCHRAPEKYIRPKDEVFNLHWSPPDDQEKLGRQLVKEYNIPVERLSDCYTCHR